MSWAMLYACLLLAAAAADSVHSNKGLSEGKDQMLASPYAQPSVAHFQLGSGAGSDPDFHGNENYEPANSSGHPRLRGLSVPPTSRESRNVVVTARTALAVVPSEYITLLRRAVADKWYDQFGNCMYEAR